MSRTFRKKQGIKYQNGRMGRNVPHTCRCEYCTGALKKQIEGKIADKEMKSCLKDMI